ncbi:MULTISPECIES: DUF1236 domain-containing protein [unclassified Sinorhizobium]|uniref:DUF1236 domain-containing protein n=1 Tax=unclassified Sinorhizobium TaxID=2613772 RepID=UPI0035243943
MRKTMLIAAVAFLTAGSATALAQGAVVVTPDASTTGSTTVVPGEVRTYVMEQKAPSVVYDGDVIVGTTLPDTVQIQTIPDNSGYAYAVVNERRVIVEPQSHRVIEVLK